MRVAFALRMRDHLNKTKNKGWGRYAAPTLYIDKS